MIARRYLPAPGRWTPQTGRTPSATHVCVCERERAWQCVTQRAVSARGGRFAGTARAVQDCCVTDCLYRVWSAGRGHAAHAAWGVRGGLRLCAEGRGETPADLGLGPDSEMSIGKLSDSVSKETTAEPEAHLLDRPSHLRSAIWKPRALDRQRHRQSVTHVACGQWAHAITPVPTTATSPGSESPLPKSSFSSTRTCRSNHRRDHAPISTTAWQYRCAARYHARRSCSCDISQASEPKREISEM